MISSFILSYSFDTLFTKINRYILIYELVKALEIETSSLINLVLLTILFYHDYFFSS